MQAHAKKHRTEIFRFQDKTYRATPETIKGLTLLIGGLEEVESDDDFIPATEVFPELLDDVKRPAIALRGARRKENMSQTTLAKKLGVAQGDISKMEKGTRPIGKKMALRLAKVLNIDYRVFL